MFINFDHSVSLANKLYMPCHKVTVLVTQAITIKGSYIQVKYKDINLCTSTDSTSLCILSCYSSL